MGREQIRKMTRWGIVITIVIGAGACRDVAALPSDPGSDLAVPSGMVLTSDWSTATGNGFNAISDGGTWNDIYVSGNHAPSMGTYVLTVVPGSAAGWTLTPNVMQVTHRGSNYAAFVQNTNAVPLGVSYYMRFYAYVKPTNTYTSFHPVKNRWQAPQYVFWSLGPQGSGYFHRINHIVDHTGNQRAFWPTTTLNQGVWYRFEFFVEIIDSGNRRYRVWPRVYDMNGNLILQASNYRLNGGDMGGGTLQAYYDSGSYGVYSSLDFGRQFAMGYEGTGGTPDSGQQWYYAAVAIGTGGWIGQR
jgi:hypothetical protein